MYNKERSMSIELIGNDGGAASAGYTPVALSRAPLSAAAPAPLAARARARAPSWRIARASQVAPTTPTASTCCRAALSRPKL